MGINSAIGSFGVDRELKTSIVKGKKWFASYSEIKDGVTRYSSDRANTNSNGIYYVLIKDREIAKVFTPHPEFDQLYINISESFISKNSDSFVEHNASDFELITDESDTYCGVPYTFFAFS